MPNTRPATSAQVDTRPPPLTTTAPDPIPAAPVVAAVPPVLLTAAEVAELLRVDVYTVRKYARSGELPSYLVARQLRFDAQAVTAWLDDRRRL